MDKWDSGWQNYARSETVVPTETCHQHSVVDQGVALDVWTVFWADSVQDYSWRGEVDWQSFLWCHIMFCFKSSNLICIYICLLTYPTSLYLVISRFIMFYFIYFIQSPCAGRSRGETRADRMTDGWTGPVLSSSLLYDTPLIPTFLYSSDLPVVGVKGYTHHRTPPRTPHS